MARYPPCTKPIFSKLVTYTNLPLNNSFINGILHKSNLYSYILNICKMRKYLQHAIVSQCLNCSHSISKEITENGVIYRCQFIPLGIYPFINVYESIFAIEKIQAICDSIYQGDIKISCFQIADQATCRRKILWSWRMIISTVR